MANRIRRALVSVFEKDGVVDLCRSLAENKIEILSSGGTARLLRENDVPVVPVAEYTGFPEMLDGRVKTLHPKIHGGILAMRDNEGHMEDLVRHEIQPIDLVVVNLYPFEKTAARRGLAVPDVIEMIDIGGPTMVRAAAKNFAHVGVVVDPADYERVREQIGEDGSLSDALRLELSTKAFRHTSNYDSAVTAFLAKVGPDDELVEVEFPDRLQIDFAKIQDLRYGENPHQRAAFYRDPLSEAPSIARSTQLQGKELSFNNILDFDAALALAAELEAGACVIIKHGNPCGTALGKEPAQAFRRALKCDPLSAFGGVIAFNRRVDRRAADAVAEHFFEGVVAPEFDPEARERLAKKKKLRLLEIPDLR